LGIGSLRYGLQPQCLVRRLLVIRDLAQFALINLLRAIRGKGRNCPPRSMARHRVSCPETVGRGPIFRHAALTLSNCNMMTPSSETPTVTVASSTSGFLGDLGLRLGLCLLRRQVECGKLWSGMAILAPPSTNFMIIASIIVSSPVLRPFAIRRRLL